jgi:hypothetical protein
MPRYSINPTLLIDRPWWCGHPFRAHRGRARRWCMMILLLVLGVVIGGYAYLTDPDRVREMAENYLSERIGGRVEIGSANLSIFQGLSVNEVKVSVDPGADRPDTLLFSAQSLVLNYDPRKLIAGKLDATQIIAQKPHVYLTLSRSETGDTWNYQRLAPSATTSRPVKPGPPQKLSFPEVMLRNAEVEIGEMRAGVRCRVGSMAVDGQFLPSGDSEHYLFELQTRGVTLGPYAQGTIDSSTGQITAHLRNVEFGDDLRSMFPWDVREWWERHELAGRVDSVDITYSPSRGTSKQHFAVRTALRGVTLAVHREEWYGRDAADKIERLENAMSLVRGPYEAAGFRVAPAPTVARPVNDRSATANNLSPVQNLLAMVDAAPLMLSEVTGAFNFTHDGIDAEDLLVRVGAGDAAHPDQTNAFKIRGHISGYRPESPAHLQIDSSDPHGLYFPAKPTFLASLPVEIRNFYEAINPEGTCRVRAEINRVVPGTIPQISGSLELVDARFKPKQFAYPFRGVGGKIGFGRDPFTGKDFITVNNLHASGIAGGPNDKALIIVNGKIGPIGADVGIPGIDLHVTGADVSSERALTEAMPWDVRGALHIFDAPGKEDLPVFFGNMAASITRKPGPGQRVLLNLDLDLVDGQGQLREFPYYSPHVSGKMTVHTDWIEIKDVTVRGNGDGIAKLKGYVRWADEHDHLQPIDIDVQIAAQNVPMDETLISSIPRAQQPPLRKLGAAGLMSCEGRIYTIVPPDWREHTAPGKKPVDPPPRFDLMIGMREGTIWPSDGLFSVSNVAGSVHLTEQKLDVIDLHGNRDGAQIAATGTLEFGGPSAGINLRFTGRNVTLDRPLYAMLPPDGRRAWDELRPSGTMDVTVEYAGPFESAKPQTLASAAPKLDLPPEPHAQFRIELEPRNLKVLLRTAPYPITFSGGTIVVTPEKAVLKEVKGAHGPARVEVSGSGTLDGSPAWELSVHGDNIPSDAQLRSAMPPALRNILDGIKLGGTLNLDITKMSYRAGAAGADPDIDAAGTIGIANGMMDIGVPMTSVNGSMKFAAVTKNGRVDSLTGTMLFPALLLGGRPVRDLQLALSQPQGRNELHIDNIQGRVSGGELAGNVLLTMPDQGANRYTMNLIVRNADVRELTGETDTSILGDLTASLALEGAWGDPKARRGRGDVVVAGKQLYRIPLVLGVLQVTNLSLPIGGPFTKGTARYSVEGTRVNFEQMDLRSDTMMMTGSGYLDFGSKQVHMSLATDNPAGLKVPFISDLWQGARQELLRINVRGTVQDPKVEAASMATFTTTIDQVFKGDAQK